MGEVFKAEDTVNMQNMFLGFTHKACSKVVRAEWQEQVRGLESC